MRLLDCFDAALCIDPGNVDAQWNKSHVLLTLGRYEEGLSFMKPDGASSSKRYKSVNLIVNYG